METKAIRSKTNEKTDNMACVLDRTLGVPWWVGPLSSTLLFQQMALNSLNVEFLIWVTGDTRGWPDCGSWTDFTEIAGHAQLVFVNLSTSSEACTVVVYGTILFHVRRLGRLSVLL